MEYEVFREELKGRLHDMLGNDVTLEDRQVEKINETKDGVIIKYPNSNVAPMVYFGPLYSEHLNGESVEEIAYKVALELGDIKHNIPVTDDMMEKEFNPDNLYAIVINADMNEKLLSDLPHRIVEDLAVVPRYRFDENASMIIHNAMCDEMKLTKEEVLDIAISNNEKYMGFEVDTLQNTIKKMCDVEVPDDCNMYVITNKMRVDGAAAVISDEAMKLATETIQENFYIIPSSRHEVLLLPESYVDDPMYLKTIIKDINDNVLDKGDKLSDNLYLYDINARQMSIVGKCESEEIDSVKNIEHAR